MLFVIDSSLGDPVSRVVDGLSGHGISSSTPSLPVDERLALLPVRKGRRLIEYSMHICGRENAYRPGSPHWRELAIADAKQS
ncbi:hypothetical protein [Mesorhizobium australafricanum]|uniref:Uncharacterized protein n=1 Tax=Mesorhizobium australafricanum TaxID=3072311 RepID=A0ABU4X387_9HYPH|nr:hypothetical protein [Mesorhizobium sp. VK3E]MDX8441637.1 hypothetical protein [Mesorhizobium sp. VK3E]